MNNYDNYYNYMNDMNFQNTFLNNNPNLTNIPQPTYKLDSKIGFMRGNMFENLYNPYKNYKPREIEPTNERETLLNKVRQYRFAMIDLNLYLDNYPDDENVVKIFNNYRNLEKQASMEYESKYGPLTIDDAPSNVNTWIWDNSPWPWEVQ
ncbi:MAG: spore coat protein CotJB [Bacilli bacterium]